MSGAPALNAAAVAMALGVFLGVPVPDVQAALTKQWATQWPTTPPQRSCALREACAFRRVRGVQGGVSTSQPQ